MKPLYQELPFSVEHYINFYREDLPYFIVPWHYHPEIEIMCIEQGSGTRFVGDHIENYEVGDVCIIGPQLPHEWRNDKEFFGEGTGLRSVCLCVYFRKELFEGVMINLPEFMNIRNLIERSRRGVKFTGTGDFTILPISYYGRKSGEYILEHFQFEWGGTGYQSDHFARNDG